MTEYDWIRAATIPLYPSNSESLNGLYSRGSNDQSGTMNPPTDEEEQREPKNAVDESRAIGNRNLSWAEAKVSRKVFSQEQLASWMKILKRMSMAHWLLLFLSCAFMLTAFPASSILTRLYFVDGGTSKWLISWVAPAGWPITAGLLLVFCILKREYPTPLTWEMTIAYAVIGFLSAADNLMFAWAYAYLPASTAALLSSSSLTFTAILAYLIVGQKFNSSTVNAVAFMTIAAVILGLDSNSDRPYGVTSHQYATGFVLSIAGSALHGLIFALSEKVFISLLGRESFRLVLEVQTATSFFATLFTTVGVLIAGDFQKVHDEAQVFRHGPSAYYQVFTWSIVTFQLGILGSVGCLYLASTLLAGILNAARVPVTAIAAVMCFDDPMGGFKILAIVLTVWSFGTYIWGTYEQQRPVLDRKQLSSTVQTWSSPSERIHHAPNSD